MNNDHRDIVDNRLQIDKSSIIGSQVLQMKMVKRLQSISSLALNHLTMDSADDDDDDSDLELTPMTPTPRGGGGVTHAALRYTSSADSSDLTIAEINKLRLRDLDSSDGEATAALAASSGDGVETENGTLKRRKGKKKRGETASSEEAPSGGNAASDNSNHVGNDATTNAAAGCDGNKVLDAGAPPPLGGVGGVPMERTPPEGSTDTTPAPQSRDNKPDQSDSGNTNGDASAETSQNQDGGGVTSQDESHVNGVDSEATPTSNSGYDSTSSVN